MKHLEELCRESADDALAFLLALLGDADAPANTRLQAAREILDRGFGKPVDRTAVLNMSARSDSDGSDLTTAELMRIASGGGGVVTRLPPAES